LPDGQALAAYVPVPTDEYKRVWSFVRAKVVLCLSTRKLRKMPGKNGHLPTKCLAFGWQNGWRLVGEESEVSPSLPANHFDDKLL
jgi:hypothetical protein